MTDLITEARELCAAATPGQWKRHDTADYAEIHNGDTWGKDLSPIALVGHTDDANFIARSRTLIPELCDALEKAEEQNKQLIRKVSELARESVERAKALARLEAEVEGWAKAKQEGRLVVLPCKVGDTVWAYDDVFNQIAPHQVDMVELYGHKGMSFCSNWRKGGELMADLDFDAEDFGKTVFLTRAEAEAALKGAEHE